MALTGSFKETPFADLVQLYSMSQQTVAVRVSLGGGEKPDGIFYFDKGDLAGAALAGATGRDAVRKALRLRQGQFWVDAGVTPPERGAREPWRKVLFEEMLRLDEENRTPTPSAMAVSGASAGAPAGAPRTPPRGTPPAPPAPPRAPPPAQRPPPGGGDAPPRRFPVAAAALGGLAAVMVIVTAWVLAGSSHDPSAISAQSAAPAAAAAVRGVHPGEIVLGMAASLTGSNKERGRAMRAGWEMAIADVNATGGVHGRRLRLVTRDDGYDPARTLPAMKELVEKEGVFAVVGNVGTATAKVAIPYALEHRLPFYGALSGADLLRKSPPDRYVFNYRPSLAQETEAAVRYLVDVRRLEPGRIAVLTQDDDFGESGWRGAEKQLGAYGVAAAAVLRLSYPRNTADVSAALAALKARAGAVDAVVMVATYKPAATFVRKAKDAGLKLSFTVVSADSNGLAEELAVSGARYTEDVVVTQVVPVPTGSATAVMAYRQSLERHSPGDKPGSTSLEAWTGAQIFVEALRRAGPELDPDKLVAALESIADLDLGIGTVFGLGPADHQASSKVWGWLLQPDGTYRQIDLE